LAVKYRYSNLIQGFGKKKLDKHIPLVFKVLTVCENKKEVFLMNRRDKQKAETLADILNSAEELFAKHGYENTSVNQIAKHCGVTKGAFYHHFKSKDEVLERMCHNHYNALIETTKTIMQKKDKPALDRIKEVIAASRKLGMERSNFLAEFLRMRHQPGNLVLKERLQKYDKMMYVKIVAPLLAEAKAEGTCDFQAEPEILTIFINKLDRTVTEEINEILTQGNIPEQEEEIRAVLDGFAYSLKQLLNLNEKRVKKFLDIDSAMQFFRTILHSSEEKK
jgi:AcrR family transcriptional regulator